MSIQPMTRMTSWRALAAISLIGILIMLVLPYVLSPYYLGLVIKMVIFALFAMSLDLLIGYTGMASLGHAAYFGIAAYATGLLALKLGWSVYFALPAGLVVAALTATLFGLLALRTRGSYFLMITLALSQVLWGIAFGWRSLTGGDDGLPEVPRPDLGLPWSLAANTPFYYFVLALAGIGALLLIRIVHSPFGYALRGIRESETRMLALGYNVWRYKLAAFVLAGTFAGLAGCLYVYYNRFVSPDYIHVVRSAEVLLMVILGGAGSLIGPTIGAALIVLLENIISGYTERWLMLLGVVYVLVALFAPNGLTGLVRDFRKRRDGP
ncbi:MAG: branched-chain amino acid transport system permease protein [Alphaproteobacteria bacterium]|nr:branched-chain amino acid transport system permease protein [Alphaproteobacteria bacterium]